MTAAIRRHENSATTACVQSGVSLIELLVALTIGVILIFGATQVYVDSRNTYNINETTARLQETARYAMAIIEPDVRMSNYWGLLKGAGVVTGQAAQTAASAGAPTSCGTNFAHDLLTNIQGDNNGYVLSATRTAACNAFGAGAIRTADTLTIRRASINAAAAPTVNTLQICSTRVSGRLFSDGSACTAAPDGLLNDLIVHAYYVSRDSTAQPGLPSLRRKSLVSLTAAAPFPDQEIIPGVEDLQVQFGVDLTGVNGVATRYVNPGAVPAGAQIVSVRLWLLVRSDSPEAGFTDNRIYEYGDRLQANGVSGDLNAAAAAGQAYQPSLNADTSFTGPMRYRRLLVSRTFQVRNAIGT